MFNVKTISEILVRLPLDELGTSARAGPPFEMPYTTALPPDDLDCWRLYRDLLETSSSLCAGLMSDASATIGRDFLRALRELDAGGVAWLDQLISGAGRRTGARA